MTKWEMMRLEEIRSVIKFLNDSHMDAWQLCKIAKELCCCGSCHYFVQHYTKEGEALDWGHCCKGNIQHSKKTDTACCGSWILQESGYRINDEVEE